jgi:signal transduction histidine kinase
MGNAASGSAEILWWIFLATVLAVFVLIGGLGIAMVIAQRRLVAVHRSYTQRLLEAHEAERARVAREVHDDAIQRLVIVEHELDELGAGGHGLDAARLHRLDGIRNEVQDLADALRKLAHRLHPAAIEQAGVSVALAQLAEELERVSDLHVELDLPDARLDLSREARLALFRIAQESLRNVVRHSGVRRASLTLRRAGSMAELVIQDSGVGFDPNARQRAGIGLVGIDERARLVGGTARIQSAPDGGTTVAVRVPLDGTGDA